MSTDSSDFMPFTPTELSVSVMSASARAVINGALAASDHHRAHRECLQQLQQFPQDPDAWNIYAETLHRMERPAAAADALRQSLSISPRQPETLANLASLLTECGESLTALELLQSAVQLYPNFAPVYNGVGQAHHQLGQFTEAARAYRRALRLDPHAHSARVNLGAVLLQQGDPEEAERLLREAVRRDPAHRPSRINLAAALNQLQKFAEAEEHARVALRLAEHCADARNNLGMALLGQGDVRRAIAALRRAAELAPHLTPNYLFALGHDDEATEVEICEAHRRWGQQLESAVHPLTVAPRATTKVRIGYVSGDFRKHAVARYLLPLLMWHDQSRFQIIGYSESFVEDPVTEALQGLCHDWRITVGASSEAVASQIIQDQIDVLVDLSGHTRGNRLDVFALRPAPVQVTWLGYPHTTGLSRIDYLLTNRILNPEGTESSYAEQLFRLDGPTACWLPPQDAPELAAPPSSRNGWVTFGALHRPSKVSEATLRLWVDVLRAVPNAKLRLLHPQWTGKRRLRLLEAFAENGLKDQLQCRLRATSGNYLEEYNEIDVALDTTPWTGGTTVRDACWMGVLPIALCGARRSARGSADVLHWLGLNDWVAHSHEEYVATAARAAADLATRQRLRTSLRTMVAERLCNATEITASVEAGFMEMLERKAA